jgi:hypothetical protein
VQHGNNFFHTDKHALDQILLHLHLLWTLRLSLPLGHLFLDPPLFQRTVCQHHLAIQPLHCPKDLGPLLLLLLLLIGLILMV